MTDGEIVGGSVVDCGERSWVKTGKPGSVPKDISDIASLVRKGGMTGLGRERAQNWVDPIVLEEGGGGGRVLSRRWPCICGSEGARRH